MKVIYLSDFDQRELEDSLNLIWIAKPAAQIAHDYSPVQSLVENSSFIAPFPQKATANRTVSSERSNFRIGFMASVPSMNLGWDITETLRQ